MELGNAPKEFFEKYRQRYLDDRRRLSNNIKSFVEKKDRITRISYQPYKWLFILPLLITTTLICGIFAIFSALLFTPRTGGSFAVLWARINSFFTPMTVHVTGAENIEPGMSYVITSNHQSLYDIYVLYGWLGLDFKWVMKKELETVPVLGLACKVLGHIFIDRSDTKNAVETINAAKTKIVDGTSVLFFPEGTRSSDGKIGPFKKGAFKMAIDLGIPVLPVTINGTRNILPKGSLDLMPGGVTMIIHKPISIKGYREENMDRLMNKTRMIINASLD
ncbi:MAG: 1-acyl-sn-glycerol-3-phosphate acyltransferase [Deltaproteobacteria bacterium]|nr:1-acyl-sn-glycerol-3-phosphate acyltransferase [Deltaproteobacteria bacterium]